MKRIMIKIVSSILTTIDKVKLLFKPKWRLERETIVISPTSWKSFSPPRNSSRIKDLQYDIKYLELNSIKRSDFSKIIAYIGKLEVGQLKLFGQELQWLQIPSHGANGFERKSLYKNENVVVSCVKDVYSDPIAQYCISAYYLFNTYSFRPKGKKSDRCDIIPDKVSIMIFGVGNIGMTLAKKCYQMGWSVFGVKRHVPEHLPECMKAIYTLDEAMTHLKDADYIVNILPEDDSTKKIYDIEFFKAMKSNALFCNVGRKSAVIDKDIAYAVQNGIIRGAILDVHDDYNYNTPDIILTGHSSSVSRGNDEKFDRYFSVQLNAFLDGQEIKNQITLR